VLKVFEIQFHWVWFSILLYTWWLKQACCPSRILRTYFLILLRSFSILDRLKGLSSVAAGWVEQDGAAFEGLEGKVGQFDCRVVKDSNGCEPSNWGRELKNLLIDEELNNGEKSVWGGEVKSWLVLDTFVGGGSFDLRLWRTWVAWISLKIAVWFPKSSKRSWCSYKTGDHCWERSGERSS